MDYLSGVDWRQLTDQWPVWATAVPNLGPLLPQLGLLAFVLGMLVVLRPRQSTDGSAPNPKGHGRGLLGWLKPRRVEWKIGNVTIDLHGRHAAAIGATGSGKSTALAGLVTGRHPTLILAFDRSDPLEAAVSNVGGIIWRPTGTLGWQILAGTPLDVCDRLTASWPTGSADTGVYRSIAREAIFRAVEDMDNDRSLAGLLSRLELLKGGNRLEQGAAEGWVARLRDLDRALGPALGDDLELGAAMRAGQTIMLQLNAFRSPSLTPLIGAVALLDTLRVADEVGNFRLLIDEGGALGERADELDALFRAGRARNVAVCIATQIASDLRKVVQQNASAWALFYQDDLSARRWCAQRTGLDPEAFDEGQLPRLECWVKLGGRLGRARLKPVQTRRTGLAERPRLAISPVLASTGVSPRSGGAVQAATSVALPAPIAAPSKPAYLGEDEQLEVIWQRFVFPEGPDGCWISTYSRNTSGRPRCSFNGQEWLVYALMLALHDERPLHEVRMRMAAKTLTVDHTCERIVCGNPAHLEWSSRSRNSHLRWARAATR